MSERGLQVAAMPVVRFRLGVILVTVRVSMHNHVLQLFITVEETKGHGTKARIEQL